MAEVVANSYTMKPLNLLLLSILISTCCGVKSVTDKTTSEETNAIVETVPQETPEVPESAKKIITPESEAPDEEINGIEESAKDPRPGDIVEVHEIEDSQVEIQVFDHSLWNQLLQKHVSDQGNVNYKGFRADRSRFSSYLRSLSENPPQNSWSKDETLAYWMNVYNAFTVKLILDNYPTNSIKDIDGPWSQRFIKIGEKWYTLNDIEHRIIRKMDEPRIHFALVCAAVSCPRLFNKAFTAHNLEKDLVMLTKGFLNDNTKNELSKNSVKLSRIFKWYGVDFKKNGSSLIDFLNKYSDVVISPKAKKSFKDYNWKLNE
jgi:hypothetical protein